MDLCQQRNVSIFNMLSSLVIAFLPRSKCLLIVWLQSPSPVILEPKKRKSVTIFTFSPSICHEVMGLDAMILDFYVGFKPAFPFSFTFIKRLFSFSLLSAIRGLHIWSYWYFSLQSWFQPVLHPVQHFCMMYSAWTPWKHTCQRALPFSHPRMGTLAL